MSGIEFRARVKLGQFDLDAGLAADKGVTALYGPSGSGKSTILRLIAGLLRPDWGRIVLGGQVVYDSAAEIDVPAHKRRVGFVFQDGLLFPHLSVRKNLLYGPWVRRMGRPAALDHTIEILDLARLLDRAPRTLSGGERQRVAIGRALLSDPAILLMDEPVTAIDQERRAEILPYLELLSRESPRPFLYVSHAMAEIERLTDDIVFLRGGRVVDQTGVRNEAQRA